MPSLGADQGRTSVNREHIAHRFFSSTTWMVYCVVQILASLVLILIVAIDLKQQ